jgi:opine dehydrogenase
MNTPENYTVIGAGHGGKAMAAHLALMGLKVTLYNRTFDHIEAIAKRGGLDLEGAEARLQGFARLQLATSNLAAALAHAQVVMVVLPSSAHADIAKKCAPHLQDGQIVLLHPGRTCGAIEFRKALDDAGCCRQLVIAEAETFIYASRSDGPAQARIFRIKEAVPLAALPARETAQVLEAIHPAYPQYIDGVNVLHTGLNNMGAIFHPALTLLNAGWIESTHGNFQFYIDGVTQSTARVLDVLDRERVTVASALGIRARTAMEWLQMAYNTSGDDLNEAIHNQPGYYGINAPSTLNHRYIFEDVPMSLVPMASLGQHYGVSVRGMDALIRLACIVHRTDYWRRGRTLDRLGIGSLSVTELTHYVNDGVRTED